MRQEEKKKFLKLFYSTGFYYGQLILDSIGYPPGNLEECTPYFYPQEMGSLRPLSNSRFLLMFTSIVIKFPELLDANICGLSGIP